MPQRICSSCGSQLTATAVRCEACGTKVPDGQGLPSDPDQPVCAVCGNAMELMAESCPSCGEVGYPALRPRQGRISKGVPEEFLGPPEEEQ